MSFFLDVAREKAGFGSKNNILYWIFRHILWPKRDSWGPTLSWCHRSDYFREVGRVRALNCNLLGEYTLDCRFFIGSLLLARFLSWWIELIHDYFDYIDYLNLLRNQWISWGFRNLLKFLNNRFPSVLNLNHCISFKFRLGLLNCFFSSFYWTTGNISTRYLGRIFGGNRDKSF